MNEHSTERMEDLLAQVPIDDAPAAGHHDKLRERALGEFDRARRRRFPSMTYQLTRFGSFLMTHPAPRWTALSIALCAALAWFLWPDRDKQAFALDRMIDSIVEARTATFHMTMKVEGQPEQSIKAMFLAPDRFRQELGGGVVNIVDWSERKIVGLDPNSKQVTVFNLIQGEGQEMPGNQFEELRKTLRKAKTGTDGAAEPVGEREIAGRKAVGFRFAAPAQTLILWGDAETELPLMLEGVFHGPPRTEFTMTDYQFNMDLDESLFSLELPEGWSVHTLDVDVSEPAEADLVKGLRRYSELTGGEFPDSLSPLTIPNILTKLAPADGQASDEHARRMMGDAITIGRGLEFALQLPRESDAHYAGKGAKLGDPNRVIFWYKPKDSQTYRVIDADLTARDAAAPPVVEGAQELWESAKP